mmetsp:Transcript_56309/g.158711  ORF Transcript_56309/g.158711 Transcript_56309/m.158711 type:complete len:274 (+) Transcript_56309:812-1633(+)
MAPSEQQPSLLADESGSDAPAPAPIRGAPSKYAAAAGLCLMAVLGAGVAMHGSGTPAAPSSGHADDYFIGLAASENHTFQHMSAECGDALEVLEAEEEKDGGESHEVGHNRTCKDGQMAVLLSREVHGMLHELSKCFPADECKCENIKAELAANAKQVHDEADVKVTCVPVGTDTSEGEAGRTHMSETCKTKLKELEKEEEADPEKEKESAGHGKTCEDDQMTVNMTKEVHGFEVLRSKCFPKDCKCENIQKDMDDHAAALHLTAKVVLTCDE